MLKISVGIKPNKDTGKPELTIDSSIETPRCDVPTTDLHEKIDLEKLAKERLRKNPGTNSLASKSLLKGGRENEPK